MANHMTVLETLKWSWSHGFYIKIVNNEDGIVFMIDDGDGLIPNAELHCLYEEIDKIEKVLAEVMSDLYNEKEKEK